MSVRWTTNSTGDLAACLRRMDQGAALRESLMGKPQPQLPYAQPLLDAIALFESLSLNYALIGGIATMYYGQPRFTEDVDFVVTTGHMDVLAANPATMQTHHFDPSCTFKLYHSSGVEVDIWKDEHSDSIISRAREIDMAGRRVRIADPHDLIAMKLRAGRSQDDHDVFVILRNTPIDEVRLRQLVTPEQFGKYLVQKTRTK